LNGPNLNLLGVRQPEIYGSNTLTDVERFCRHEADEAGFELSVRQTNAEHEMVGWLHEARSEPAGVVINPAGFSYAAYSILDALKMLACPVIELHISNIYQREGKWRAILAAVVSGIVSGLGVKRYSLPVRHLAHSLAMAKA
jgi:3-dehydroquinate dehydratase-2